MTYALVDADDVLIAYPASLADLRLRFPQTSFPANPSKELLSSYGLRHVAKKQPPVHDAFYKTAVEDQPSLVDGGWVQQWTIRDRPESELPSLCDYHAFWDAFIASPIYQQIRSQAGARLNVNLCFTELISAMDDAKAGRPNKDVLQACITSLLQALNLGKSSRVALTALFAKGNLDRVYSLFT